MASMYKSLEERYSLILETFLDSEPMRRLRDGDLSLEEYRSVLRQIYHHTRENPQLQALATVYFRGRQRDMVRLFFKHAASEIGHDQLALNDFVTLGGDPTSVPYENPLPATTALLAYGFYQIYNLNPLGYLGYLYFLEFTGTQAGDILMNALRRIGATDNALTFLRDHTEIDVGHNKLMEKYVAQLIRTEADIDAVTYAMRTTGYLYSQMIKQAMDSVKTPIVTGWNWEELNADAVRPADVSRQVA